MYKLIFLVLIAMGIGCDPPHRDWGARRVDFRPASASVTAESACDPRDDRVSGAASDSVLWPSSCVDYAIAYPGADCGTFAAICEDSAAGGWCWPEFEPTLSDPAVAPEPHCVGSLIQTCSDPNGQPQARVDCCRPDGAQLELRCYDVGDCGMWGEPASACMALMCADASGNPVDDGTGACTLDAAALHMTACGKGNKTCVSGACVE